MTKRIVSGIFLLIALGALGLILAGALTSGEQLIVRFLTAIIVAALALYVISDLRLRTDDSRSVPLARATVPAPRITTSAEPHPANSTAAFMATVTGRRSADNDEDTTTDHSFSHGHEHGTAPDYDYRHDQAVTATGTGTGEVAPTSSNEQPSPYSADFDEAALRPFGVPTDRKPVDHNPLDHSPTGHSPTGHSPTGHNPTGHATNSQAGDRPTPNSKGSLRAILGIDPPTNADHTAAAGVSATEATTNGPKNNGPILSQTEADYHHVTEDVQDPVATFASSAEQERPSLGSDHGERTQGVVHSLIGKDDKSDDLNEKAQDETPELKSVWGISTNGSPTISAQTTPESSNTTESATDATKGDGQLVDLPRSRRTFSPMQAASYAERPIAPIIDLRSAQPVDVPENVEAAIQSGEIKVISSLIEDGVLSANGPISDRDVRTMVYVAFTSSELRKILLAGGSIDQNPSSMDLGEVEVFPRTVEDEAPPADNDMNDDRFAPRFSELAAESS